MVQTENFSSSSISCYLYRFTALSNIITDRQCAWSDKSMQKKKKKKMWHLRKYQTEHL